MDEQERAYLMENARRLRQLEETPAATSGLYSDMTEVEKEKLIELQFAMLESRERQIAGLQEEMRLMREQSREQHLDLMTEFKRMEERAVAAEARADKADKRAEKADKRAEAAEKRNAELEATIKSLMDGSVINNLMQQIIDVEKQRDDAKASDRQNRAERYGRTSQKVNRKENQDAGGSGDRDRDAEEEKNDMGGKDSVEKLPGETADATPDGEQDAWTHAHYSHERPYRQGQKHNKTQITEIITVSTDDESVVPQNWTVITKCHRTVPKKVTKIVGLKYNFIICSDENGQIRMLFQPVDKTRKRWVGKANSVKDAISKVSSGPLLDDDGDVIIDCVPGTNASSDMVTEAVIDHYMNNIPNYRLRNYYEDLGLSVVRQTLGNWMEKGADLLQPMIEALLDKAIQKDSIINCDETWCKVRINGKYRKRYTWCLVNKEAGIVIYCYRKGARSRKALKDILGDRLPLAMQTDGYNVYLYLDDELIDCEHLCCMAHARAKFFKAWQILKNPDAKVILDLIGKLYDLERHYEKLKLNPAEIKKRRNNEETTGIIITLRSAVDALKADGHPPLPELLDKAVNYLDCFWKQIMAYRNNGRYSIDNNVAERFIKPLANERKNSLFHGSDRMAHVATIYHTLISTCRQMKISASEYFGKLFAKLVRGCTDMASLLPMNMGLQVKNF